MVVRGLWRLYVTSRPSLALTVVLRAGFVPAAALNSDTADVRPCVDEDIFPILRALNRDLVLEPNYYAPTADA